MKIIAVINQKGGVAKTTTAVNVSASMGLHDIRMLLVDLDPQGNATMGSGIEKSEISKSMVDVCLCDATLSEVIIETEFKGLSVAPSNQDLTVAEVEMRDNENAPYILRENFKQLAKEDRFDVVIIDCPPALNILTVNAMAAADFLIVPIQCEYFALEGLSALLDTVKDMRKTVNKKLDVLGFIRTMYDGRSRLSREVSSQLDAYFKERMFETVVPRNIRLAEAPSYGMPVHYFDKSSKGAKAYLELTDELLERLIKEEG